MFRLLYIFLGKARSRIGDLVNEKLCLQGERQELIEQVFTMTSELKKCKNQDDARKYENAQFIKVHVYYSSFRLLNTSFMETQKIYF